MTMAVTPITLSGNLGERHRRLNTLVREAGVRGASLQEFQALPEHSPVDRLFKIDLASQLGYVDYIIQNLQDDDMLYVSRALKSKWLVDHHDVINPKHLESVLYPTMIKPAVSKLKHWTYINLRDPSMCQEFYLYYKENTFEFAIKYLPHCCNEFILQEVPTILAKMSSQHLKILSEKCPRVAEIYYNSLATDEVVRPRYLENQQSYYNSVKCVLKSDADVFLNITEKYFNMNSFRRLSPSASDYILRCHKHRFTNKPELYTAYLLHVQTLADRLSVEECQELVVRLARAKYLQHWFEYKAVEPLVKRLSPDKRAAFKKRVFVEKDVGESVTEWPYEVPAPPPHTYPEAHVFDDQDFRPLFVGGGIAFPLSASYRCEALGMSMFNTPGLILKTELDRLFDEFRFVGFSRALHELGRRLGAAGSPERRRDIFLVLVSKSGGRSEAVSALLSLAARHSNEPVHIRAAVLRSLVKRAQVWRLPAEVWINLLEFGHGLGLDGSTAEAECREGLHAVVIRQLLEGKCEPAITAAFLEEFSTLSEYSLSSAERVKVAAGLQNLLSAAALVAEPVIAAKLLSQLLDALNTYRVCIVATSPVVGAIVSLASRDAEVTRPLLQRLYEARVARRELLRLNLEFRRDQASLMNVLRHDLLALDYKQFSEIIATSNTNFDSFISKLAIYFQNDNFVTQLRTDLKEKYFDTEDRKIKHAKLARRLASLSGRDLEQYVQELDSKRTEVRRWSAMLRANAHRARPAVAVAEWGWRRAGVKAVATRAMRGRQAERADLTRALAAHRRTLRVALALSMLSGLDEQVDTFTLATKLRPAAALRALLLYFRRFGDKSEVCIWNIVKPVMLSIDLSKRDNLRRLVKEVKVVPQSIKPDYCVTLYIVLLKTKIKHFYSNVDDILCDVSKHLPEVENSLEPVLLKMLEMADAVQPVSCPSIFVRYFMLSKSDEDLEGRFEKLGEPLLTHLDVVREKNDWMFRKLISETMRSLMYNAAFFNTKCTSCLLVIEKFLAWMETFMPKEEYFNNYAQVHLTMLYCKAVRQSLKQLPAVFAEPRRRLEEGVDAVGFVFGRYIARELAQLVASYFDSVVELYSGALVSFLVNTLVSGSSRAKFVVSVLKGILAEGVGTQRRLAVYIYKHCQHEMKEPLQKEIKELLYKVEDIQVLVRAETTGVRFY
ncbi:uncharacterized protein LOC113505490 [Trichoplusia ni]|uniref:Uncharacterized protein LOC113505490 n=1 Tax=Trichoplusia ni TaxID=7111 RepID=A0A7E5WV35_TRINI|nr:uncharacterized protein LOC113505490 [Trichoplusia ni]